jgi:hypothetical protein
MTHYLFLCYNPPMPRTLLIITVLVFALLALAPAGAQALTPHEDREVLAKLATYDGPDAEAAAAAGSDLAGLPRERMLPALADALGKPAARAAALRFIRLSLPDTQLAPFITPLLAGARDETLFLALLAAREVPERAYIAPLLDHALESDYLLITVERDDELQGKHYASAFAEGAELLFRLSEGKAGLAAVPRNALPPDAATQATLLATWRQWWAAQPTP